MILFLNGLICVARCPRAVIANPKLRPANPFLLSEPEKKQVRILIAALTGCGLSYRPERTFGTGRDGVQQGVIRWMLDPPIHMMVSLPLLLIAFVLSTIYMFLARWLVLIF
jgi:hypothetical protein